MVTERWWPSQCLDAVAIIQIENLGWRSHETTVSANSGRED